MNKILKQIINQLSIDVCRHTGLNPLEKDKNGNKLLDIAIKNSVDEMFPATVKNNKQTSLTMN